MIVPLRPDPLNRSTVNISYLACLIYLSIYPCCLPPCPPVSQSLSHSPLSLEGRFLKYIAQFVLLSSSTGLALTLLRSLFMAADEPALSRLLDDEDGGAAANDEDRDEAEAEADEDRDDTALPESELAAEAPPDTSPRSSELESDPDSSLLGGLRRLLRPTRSCPARRRCRRECPETTGRSDDDDDDSAECTLPLTPPPCSPLLPPACRCFLLLSLLLLVVTLLCCCMLTGSLSLP